MSSSFITSNRLTPTLSPPPHPLRRRNNRISRPSSFKCHLSSSDDHTDSSNSSSLFKTLSTTLAVSSAASALFLTDSLHFLIPDLSGGNANGGLGGSGGGSSSGGGGGGGGNWFNGDEGSFWSRILSPSRAIADEPKSQDWDSHELPVNITVQLNKLSGFKRYKISEITFFDRKTKRKIGTEDSFLDMVSLKPGGVYTKAQLQKELESLASCGMFEKVDMEGKTNADGSMSLTISFAESMWEKAERFRCINVGLMGQSKPVEMDPDMTEREKLEFFRRQEREYKRRIDSFLLFFGLVAFTQQFGNQEASVSGTIWCKSKPITANTTVTIWDDDFIGDDELNSTMTESDGSFYVYGQEFVYFSFKPFISFRHQCGLASLCKCGKRCEYETRIWLPSTVPGGVHRLGNIRLERLPAMNSTVVTTATCPE